MDPHPETDVLVLGAGPAGLMAADAARERGARVTVLDAKRSPGRKFLVAGMGGLNLTHAEPLETFVPRYGAAAEHLRPFLVAYPPARLRAFADALGQETWVGSSGRVFPREAKAAPLLRAWVARLKRRGVAFRMRHRWLGFEGGASPDSPPAVRVFDESAGREVRRSAGAVVLAFGGGSWPATGSDGSWVAPLREAGIDVEPLQPSNAGVEIDWPTAFLAATEGKPLKNVAVLVGAERARGDLVVTRTGLEGGPVYRLNAALRAAAAQTGGPGEPLPLRIDLKPDLEEARLAERLSGGARGASRSERIRKAARLDPVARALAGAFARTPNDDPAALAAEIKGLLLPARGLRPLAEAISSAGGVRWSALDDRLMLRTRPGVFAAGEMIDWDAPTGGYLLQACVSTGRAAGDAAATWAASQAASGADLPR